jgi:RNA polymerase sigma factor (sigma-70 family)
MNQLSDTEILQAIKQGRDNEALEYLYGSLLPKVKKHICNNSGSLEDAYDVFQDSVMAMYSLIIASKFDNEKYTVHGFLFTMCKHRWINLVKKRASTQHREQNVEKEILDSSALDHIINVEKKTAMDQLFNSLGDKCTEILTMFYYYKMSIKEIAEKLGGMSEDAVKVKSHRCKKLLTDRIRGNKQLIDLLRN